MNVLGSRIRIRPTRREDFSFLQALWNDGSVMRHLGYPNGMHVTDSCMERWWSITPQAQHSDARLSSFATPHCMLELIDGTPIGELLYSLDAHQRARIDLKLARAYWGKGLATEALQLTLRELFATSAVSRVIVEPAAENAAARQVLHRCGFHPAPTDNHPERWECTRTDFAYRDAVPIAEVA